MRIGFAPPDLPGEWDAEGEYSRPSAGLLARRAASFVFRAPHGPAVILVKYAGLAVRIKQWNCLRRPER